MPCLITFHNTHDTITAESLLIKTGLNPMVMPLPSQIREGCGLALRIPGEALLKAGAALDQHEVPYTPYLIETGQDSQLYKPLPGRDLARALSITAGDIVTLTGAGGKTACLYRLGEELRDLPVLLTTTTKIGWPAPEQVDYLYGEQDLAASLPPPKPGRTLLYGTAIEQSGEKKCTGPSDALLRGYAGQFAVTVIEADGSRQLPLKGYRDNEPCIPDFATINAAVLTPALIGKIPDPQQILRYSIFLEMAGLTAGEVLTPRHLAAYLCHPGGLWKNSFGKRVLFFNQVENDADLSVIREVIDVIPEEEKGRISRIIAGSVRENTYEIL